MIPDKDQFQVQEKHNGERLITPGFGVGNYLWKDWSLRWLRSLHIDAHDRIISMGWPKFMNLNEGNDRYRVTEDNIIRHAGRGLDATLKIDGSLLIRFVQGDKVKWRTRGSFQVGLDNAYEIDYFCQKYPHLADPDYAKDVSLLFEWVSPDNTIVISGTKAKTTGLALWMSVPTENIFKISHFLKGVQQGLF